MPTLPPDTSLGFEQIILRVAEECALASYDDSDADSPATIPTDRQILDRIKRAVNDGITRMARSYPKWSSLRPQITFMMAPEGDGPLSIPNNLGENDGTIYRLPWYITGRPVNGWAFSSTSSNFSGFARDATPEMVDHCHRTASTTSFPKFAAIVPSPIRQGGDSGHDRQTKAVRFWPAPDQAYQITARFLIAPPPLVQLLDKHIFGASHDHTVVAYALWCFKEHDAKDPAMRATYRERAAQALAESIRIDQESVPTTLGPMTDPGTASGSHRYMNPGVDVLTSSMSSVL